jgi:hypothetical protein
MPAAVTTYRLAVGCLTAYQLLAAHEFDGQSRPFSAPVALMMVSIENCDRLNLDEVPRLSQHLDSHEGVGRQVVTRGLCPRT